ncbi:MAG: DNA repair protein RadA [Patescibacteria group bacterium]|nr:DNA repair protein RadA [Patescibacteria group bacterium]
MIKVKSLYVCQQCGYKSPNWLGKCPNCSSWNSFVETVTPSTKFGSTRPRNANAGPKKLSEVEKIKLGRIPTGLVEFDRVLGTSNAFSGVVPGSVVLVAGDPGIGKSTLLLQTAAKIGGLYVAGEESAEQVKIRAERIKGNFDELFILSETDVDLIIEAIRSKEYRFVVIDSIQTLVTGDLDGSAGSVGQVRECANRLHRLAKENNLPIFVIGHVTKEGAVAGPRVLEHLVDAVIYLEGERYHSFRILRSIKNRFGPTAEIGIFEMTDKGMVEVANPSALFLEERGEGAGSIVVPTMEGSRPVLTEIQALTSPVSFGLPRRTGSGVDYNRLQLLVAVLTRRAGLNLQNQDIFVNVAGGLKIFEPAADLAICLSIASSVLDKSISSGAVAIGEVGLLGEVRRVGNMEKRIAEAKKLGFNKFITPDQAKTLKEALNLAFKA